jgi:hypothetical protein
MPKCYHTGLPTSMCGHCNGTHPIVKEPFHGRHNSNEKRGESTGAIGFIAASLVRSETPNRSCVRRRIGSQWALENTLKDVAAAFGGRLDVASLATLAPVAIASQPPVVVVAPLPAPAEREYAEPKRTIIGWKDASKVEPNSKDVAAPPKNRTPNRPPVATVRKARSQSRAAAVIYARRRT